MNPLTFYGSNPAFERNLGLVTREEQAKLADACVAIAGVGGVGGWHALTLARQGVGRFRIADFDTFSTSNLNRQAGAYTSTMGESKVAVIERMILDINPHAEVVSLPAPIGRGNVESFVAPADVVLDGIDFFALEARRLLFAEARRQGRWAMTAGPLGFGASFLAFAPDRGMSFERYFDFGSCESDAERLVAFAVGLAPAGLHVKYMDLSTVDPSTMRGPSAGLACQLCGSVLAMATLALLLGWREPAAAPCYQQLDLRAGRWARGRLHFGNRGPLQLLKRALFKRMLQTRGVDLSSLKLPSKV